MRTGAACFECPTLKSGNSESAFTTPSVSMWKKFQKLGDASFVMSPDGWYSNPCLSAKAMKSLILCCRSFSVYMAAKIQSAMKPIPKSTHSTVLAIELISS